MFIFILFFLVVKKWLKCKCNFNFSNTFYAAKPEVFYITSSPVEVFIGNPLNITCGIRGDPLDPLVHITWQKTGGGYSFNETKLTYFSNSSITYATNSHLVTAATKNDRGNYTCTGNNGNGTVHVSVLVYVLCK